MRLAIIGVGYVGLVSGVCLAAKGHHVACVDINEETVRNLNNAQPHIHEQGLPALLQQVVKSGHFKATTDLHDALAPAEGVIIAVGTPSTDGKIDLRQVLQAVRQIGAWLKNVDRFFPVVIKSTVIAGTTDTVVRKALEESSGKSLGHFGLGMNPEFLREGDAIANFTEPDRIVMGFEDPQTLAFMEKLYASWTCDKLRVNTRTAELIKYSSNALLALQISAVNEIANLANALGGVDIMDVMQGVHLDHRWNPTVKGQRLSPEILTYLIPGCGFGGSCFPKDVQALRAQGKQLGLPMAILNATLLVNDSQPSEIMTGLKRAVGDLKGRTCLVLGLAFKPGTDDVRESASLRIVEELLKSGAKIHAHDPVATANFQSALNKHAQNVTFHTDWQSAVAAAEIIIVATKWPEYGKLTDIDLSDKILFDARRHFKQEDVNTGRYLAIGYRKIPS